MNQEILSTIPGFILLIDDEENLRRTLSRILTSAGWNVTGAASAAEALRLVSQNHFDLVYLDLRLPDMNGIEILRELRKIDRDLPVIVLTAHGTMYSAVQSMQLGATDYLLKPLEPEILIDRTNVVLLKSLKEKKRKELQEQIARLQIELANLEKDTPSEMPEFRSKDNDTRFIHKGPITIDLQTRQIILAESAVELPPSTFDYFVVLTRHAPEIVHYQSLVNEAQGYNIDNSEAKELAKWHIHVIRQVIEDDPRKPRRLLNVRGVGYHLVI